MKNTIKNLCKKIEYHIFSKIKYGFNNLMLVVGAYFSPLRRPQIKFYHGPIDMGTPYFLPRKQTFNKETRRYVYKDVKWMWVQFVGLGWKTKWGDYRHEWDPMISVVFLKRQYCWLWTYKKNDCWSSCYWETYLNYKYNCKNGAKTERIERLVTKYPELWSNKNITTNHHFNILKERYHKYIPGEYKTLQK